MHGGKRQYAKDGQAIACSSYDMSWEVIWLLDVLKLGELKTYFKPFLMWCCRFNTVSKLIQNETPPNRSVQ